MSHYSKSCHHSRMQNNTYPENRCFFAIDVRSTHAWSNPDRMGVQNVNQFFLKLHLSTQNCKQPRESGWTPILKHSRLCDRMWYWVCVTWTVTWQILQTFLYSPVGILYCWPDMRCACCGSQKFKSRHACMRGALTLNQSESDKLKPTNLKSVLTFAGQCSV